uniref:Uncharacterized protein n=1 Tax=Desertifilum tharense IPPAS B-1220 TaxID=1781255 RepID=A0ACD5GRN4_9CYAN
MVCKRRNSAHCYVPRTTQQHSALFSPTSPPSSHSALSTQHSALLPLPAIEQQSENRPANICKTSTNPKASLRIYVRRTLSL